MRRAATVALGVAAAGIAATTSLLVGNALSGCTPQIRPVVQPGQSWQAAYAAASGCDEIPLAAGDHGTQALFRDPAKDGASERVVFRPESGLVSVSFSAGQVGSTVKRQGADHFELRDLTVRGQLAVTWARDVVLRRIDAGSFNISGSQQVEVVGGDYGPVDNGINHIKACSGCPATEDVLVEGAVLHDVTISNPDKHSECLMIWTTGGRNITVRNSVFRNCTDFGLFVKAPSTSGVVVEDSYFDVPLLGNVATSACNPNCARGGNSIRYSTYDYPDSRVVNNVVNGGIGIDCGCVTVMGNEPGTVPLVPPDSEPPPTTTTTEPPPTTTEPPPMSTYADDFERASLGSNWRKLIGTPEIIASKDLGLVSGSFILVEWAGGTSSADQFAETEISGGMPATELARGVFVRRRASDGARYQFHYDFNGTDADPRGQWQLKLDGVPTAQARLLAVGFQPAPSAGDVIRVEAEGSTIRGLVNGQVYLTATDTALTGGTIGLASTTAGATFPVTNQPAFARFAGGALATAPPPDSLPLAIVSQDSTTVTVGWTPVAGIGYRFSVDAKVVSHTWDANRSSVKFAKKAGATFRVEAPTPGPFGEIASP